jgi:2-oxoglutarate dehydrogenase E2 component (dihydrolipoamide succinyltransferase)
MSELVEVLVPANEEGTRATVLRWCKQVGDRVVKDEPLVELETDKVTVEIPAPAAGTLTEILKPVDAEVVPDDVLARLTPVGESSAPKQHATAIEADRPGGPSPVGAAHDVAADNGEGGHDGEGNVSGGPLSPAVRRLLQEHSLVAASIAGTGRDGRITANDVDRYVADSPSASGITRIPHTAIRRRVAEHMTRSLLEAPHVTTLFEADLTRALAHRARHTGDFQARGVRLTLTAYFVSACAHALRAVPEVNATFHADALELHADTNIGVGTALGNKGLIVPVIHRAQTLNLFSIAQRLGQVVDAARAGKLAPAEVRGGTFTISNHGVSGSLLAAPIVINQPQVAILGVGKVERRVCAVQVDGAEAISVRSMCYLTLTIDHRALDAFQANAFLSSVVSTLEHWSVDEA